MRRIILTAVTFAVFQCAFAQTAPLELEKVTVTAEKRSSEAQKVSIPMNVFTESQIEDAGMESVSDLGLYIPNVFITDDVQMGETVAVFRGLAPNDFASTNSLVLVVDGIAVDTQDTFVNSLLDVEQIEVLRGPQGTLYGKNAAAGVISITTRQPGDDTEGFVSLRAEEDNTYGGSFRLSGPLKKNYAYYGFAASYDTTDGWIEDKTPGGSEHMDEKDELNLIFKLRIAPDSKNNILLKYSMYDLDGGNPPAISGIDSVTYSTVTNLDNYKSEQTMHQAVAKMDFVRRPFTLTSVTSLVADDKDLITYGGPDMLYAYADHKYTQISQEIRFTSPEESPVKWLAGVYADRTSDDWGDGMGVIYDLSAWGMGYMDMDWPAKNTGSSGAAFGEATFPISKKLSATLGARYEYIKREMDFRYEVYDYATGAELSMDYQGESVPVKYSTDESWSVALGKAALNWQYSDSLLFFASVSQGYIPGGFNWTANDADTAKYDETKSVNYELGAKSTLFDNRLNLNANIFYVRYEDLQTEQEVAPGIYRITNAGKAHAAGAEADFNAVPFAGWNIYGSLGYLRTEYDDFKEYNSGTGETDDFSGNTITNSPEYSAMTGIKYRHSSGLFLLGEYSYKGRTYFSKDNSSAYTRDAYELANVRAGYESPGGFEVYAYVKNALDKEYFSYMQDYGSGMYSIGQPRTFGVRMNYRF